MENQHIKRTLSIPVRDKLKQGIMNLHKQTELSKVGYNNLP